MQPALFDTSVYISALRRGNDAALALRRVADDAPLWLSSVVLKNSTPAPATGSGAWWSGWNGILTGLNEFWCPISATGLKPAEYWARLAAKYGYEQIGQGRLTNDARCDERRAVRHPRITANEHDYRRLAEFRAFQWQVTTVLDGIAKDAFVLSPLRFQTPPREMN